MKTKNSKNQKPTRVATPKNRSRAPHALGEGFDIHINRKRWRVRFVGSRDLRDSWGECDSPSVRNPQIRIYRNAGKRDLVNTLIHEVLHAVRPELCEEAVDETATVIERALHRLGYRMKENA
jgi:hypothetical protein